MKRYVFLHKLSKPVAIILATITGLGLIVVQSIIWLNWDNNKHTSVVLMLDAGNNFTLQLVVGVLLSILSGLLVYLSLINRMQTVNLKKTVKQLQTLFANLPGAAYRIVLNAKTAGEERIDFLSEGFIALTGYDADFVMNGNMTFINLIEESDRSHVIESLNSAVINKKMYDFECRIHRKDGRLRWLWHRGRVVSKINANEICIEGFVSDVTCRKETELALIEATAYSEALTDIAVDAVIAINSDGIITTFNRSAERVFGYAFKEIKGQNINILMPLPIRHKHNRHNNSYIDINEAKVMNMGREMTAVKKDGSTFPIVIFINEVYHQKERTFVGLIRDISKQRATEDEACLQIGQLAHVARLNALGEMASSIAHVINQPLTTISLFAQAGKRLLEHGQYERVREVFDKLSQHSQLAGSIIERVQAMTKQHESKKVTTDCHALASELAQLAKAEASIHNIEIDVTIAAYLPSVLVDVGQIQQVTLNLLRNGMQAMLAINCINGNKISLKVSLAHNNNSELQITIVDSGGGVSPECEQKLFEPFSTTKENEMGMGLSISRVIIEAHSGRIDFYNNTTCGATFYYTLPTTNRDN